MCLGVPAQVKHKFYKEGLAMALVDFDGLEKEVCIEHVADVDIDEFVLVHVGFALTKLKKDEATEIKSLLSEFLNTQESSESWNT
jgi:hydrogenase expression/formation protein HypC